MQVVINGETGSFEGIATVADLLRTLRLQGRIAVEINRRIVPRSQFDSHPVCDGDVIELVHAIGGG
ncbi:MAG: sulfur carrier protein ThiS [Gammaproteobacteria bacterium]